MDHDPCLLEFFISNIEFLKEFLLILSQFSSRLLDLRVR